MDGMDSRWSGLIAQFGLLWMGILSFRPAGERGNGGDHDGMAIIFIPPLF
jgi:hypothetical protein